MSTTYFRINNGGNILKKPYAIITIKVTEETKQRLENLKIIPDERMNNLIMRLIEHYEKNTITKEK